MQLGADADSLRVGRREMLGLLAGAVTLAACGGGSSSATSNTPSKVAPSVGSLEDATVAVADESRGPAREVGQSFCQDVEGSLEGRHRPDWHRRRHAVDRRRHLHRHRRAVDRRRAPCRRINDRTRPLRDRSHQDQLPHRRPVSPVISSTRRGRGRREGVRGRATRVHADPGHPDIDRLDIDLQAGEAAGTRDHQLQDHARPHRHQRRVGRVNRPRPTPSPRAQRRELLPGVHRRHLRRLGGVRIRSVGRGRRAHSSAVCERRKGQLQPRHQREQRPRRDRRSELHHPVLHLPRHRSDDREDVSRSEQTGGHGHRWSRRWRLLDQRTDLPAGLASNEVAQITVVAPAGADLAALDRAVAEVLLPKLGHA